MVAFHSAVLCSKLGSQTCCPSMFTFGVTDGFCVFFLCRNPNPEHISQLLGWRDLQGMRMLKPDDSHAGDRFGRTVVLHGDHLIVGADYST